MTRRLAPMLLSQLGFSPPRRQRRTEFDLAPQKCHLRSPMTPAEAAQEVVDRIAPMLNELGFSSFVFCAYHESYDGEGIPVLERQVIVNGGKNLAMQDGLRSMVIMSARWQEGQL